MAGLAKMHNTRKARAIAADARDMLGGNGILLDYQVMRHMVDLEAIHTFEGTETMQTLIVGRASPAIGVFTGHRGRALEGDRIVTNLASNLANTTRAYADRMAVRVDDAGLTYRELDEASARVAGLLHERGLKPGDRVGLMMPNVAEVPVVYYGVLRAGGVVVPMNPLLKAREVAYYLGDSRAGLVFAWHTFADEARDGAGQAGAQPIVVDSGSFPDLLASAAPEYGVADADDEDTAVILYTSGTTGHPKGAELTHGNLTSNTEVSRADIVRARPGRRHIRRASAVPRVRADRRAQRGGGVGRVPDPAAAVRRRARPADHRRPPGHRLRRRADHVRGAAARA